MTEPVLIVRLGVEIGVSVGVGTWEVVGLAVCGLDGVGGVEVPVVAVDTVMGVGVEGAPGVGEGGPVVVSLVGVVFEEVGPEVCMPVKMKVSGGSSEHPLI